MNQQLYCIGMAKTYEEALMFQEAARDQLADAEEMQSVPHGRLAGFFIDRYVEYRQGRFEQATADVDAALAIPQPREVADEE